MFSYEADTVVKAAWSTIMELQEQILHLKAKLIVAEQVAQELALSEAQVEQFPQEQTEGTE
ncbi:MAG: hypothetical protein VW907_02225, partial [Opitutae bacterium]